MFVLDLGQPERPLSGTRPHGEWSFLFELADWKFEGSDGKLARAGDLVNEIDKAFAQMDLGSIAFASVEEEGPSLRIGFDHGIALVVETNSILGMHSEDQWLLYTPFRRVWVASSAGITCESR
jgi:hypothetical protein